MPNRKNNELINQIEDPATRAVLTNHDAVLVRFNDKFVAIDEMFDKDLQIHANTIVESIMDKIDVRDREHRREMEALARSNEKKTDKLELDLKDEQRWKNRTLVAFLISVILIAIGLVVQAFRG